MMITTNKSEKNGKTYINFYFSESETQPHKKGAKASFTSDYLISLGDKGTIEIGKLIKL